VRNNETLEKHWDMIPAGFKLASLSLLSELSVNKVIKKTVTEVWIRAAAG
jgi:hypothetical protein